MARNRIHLSGARQSLRRRAIPYRDRAGNTGIPDPESPQGRAIQAAADLHRGLLVLDRRALLNLRAQVQSGLWPEKPQRILQLAAIDTLLELGGFPRLVVLLREDPLMAIKVPEVELRYLASLYARGKPIDAWVGHMQRRPRVPVNYDEFRAALGSN